MNTKLSVVLPLGSLKDNTVSLMNQAGYGLVLPPRCTQAQCNDPELDIRFLRAQEIASYVAQEKFDLGITGYDWILESGQRVLDLADLTFAKQSQAPTRWVLAAPDDSSIQSLRDLCGKRIATELMNVARAFLIRSGIDAELEFSWGATEAKAPRFVDAIVEVTETGTSLKANRLRELETICVSTPRLISNESAYNDTLRRDLIGKILAALKKVRDISRPEQVQVIDSQKVLWEGTETQTTVNRKNSPAGMDESRIIRCNASKRSRHVLEP
jgi:ATP phosphoribosyltransferase